MPEPASASRHGKIAGFSTHASTCPRSTPPNPQPTCLNHTQPQAHAQNDPGHKDPRGTTAVRPWWPKLAVGPPPAPQHAGGPPSPQTHSESAQTRHDVCVCRLAVLGSCGRTWRRSAFAAVWWQCCAWELAASRLPMSTALCLCDSSRHLLMHARPPAHAPTTAPTWHRSRA